MKLIFVCSPLRGDVEENIKKANEYCHQIALNGNCGIAPHTVFTQFLDDNNPNERQLGMEMGMKLLSRCDELLVCGDRISEGMKAEIKEAYRLGIPVNCLSLGIHDVYEAFEEMGSDMKYFGV